MPESASKTLVLLISFSVKSVEDSICARFSVFVSYLRSAGNLKLEHVLAMADAYLISVYFAHEILRRRR